MSKQHHAAAPQCSFMAPTAKLSIGSVSEPSLTVHAQYNPKELKVTQPITWNAHKSAGAGETDALTVEFGGMQPQTLTVELLFDGAEHSGFIGTDGTEDVLGKILALKQLATVRDPTSNDPAKRAPHFCVVTWGAGGMPPLQCVIESLVTTYQMFSSGGLILRATVAVQLKEANPVMLYKRAAAES